MIIDARNIADGTVLSCDVVVVGSGPAGTSLALELGARGAQIILLEAGGERYSRREQEHFAGEVVNPDVQPPLDLYRSRQFGGGSNVWGGRCSPFDPIDFEKRSWVPFSGWPINNATLEDYYVRAHEFLDIGDFCYDAESCLDGERAVPFPGMVWDKIDDTKICRWSLPTNFRTKYRRRLAGVGNIRVLLHASCLELHASGGGNRITEAVVGNGPGRRIAVRAKIFALAAGGIESARLLLVSRDAYSAGLGNEYDQVGRYFQTHVYGTVAKIRYLGNPRAVRFEFERSRDGVYVQHMLAIRPEVQRAHRLLNFYAVLNYPNFADPSHGNAILSSLFLVKNLLAHRLPAELVGKALDQKHGRGGRNRFATQLIGRHIWNVIRDSPSMLPFSWDWLARRVLTRRKLPSVNIYSRHGEYHLLYSAEQEPNPDSRVMLSRERDDFGYNRIKSDWRYTTGDIESIVNNHLVLANDLQGSRNPCVALDTDFTTLAERVKDETRLGSHHIGTTRMSEDLRTGVVDRKCRVHGVANLYVASSSVFPTSSCVSVTLLIVAVALRVADTILDELRRLR
jgi:choline dehydrogenase-like flavoprotein